MTDLWLDHRRMKDPAFISCHPCKRIDLVEDLCSPCRNNREAIFYLLEVLRAAEKIEGLTTNRSVEIPVPDIVELHKAIRKAKGMS